MIKMKNLLREMKNPWKQMEILVAENIQYA
jgi:hypothetical protein